MITVIVESKISTYQGLKNKRTTLLRQQKTQILMEYKEWLGVKQMHKRDPGNNYRSKQKGGPGNNNDPQWKGTTTMGTMLDNTNYDSDFILFLSFIFANSLKERLCFRLLTKLYSVLVHRLIVYF